MKHNHAGSTEIHDGPLHEGKGKGSIFKTDRQECAVEIDKGMENDFTANYFVTDNADGSQFTAIIDKAGPVEKARGKTISERLIDLKDRLQFTGKTEFADIKTVAEAIELIDGLSLVEKVEPAPRKIILVETAYHPPEVTFCVDGIAETFTFDDRIHVSLIAATALGSSPAKAYDMALDSCNGQD